MIKKIFLLIIIVSVVNHSFSQRGGGRNDGPAFEWAGNGKGNGIPTLFGLSAGASYGQIGNESMQAGWRANYIMGIPVNHSLSVRAEFGYTRFNAIKNGTTEALGYLELPVLASFDLTALHALHLLVGPQLSLLTDARQVASGSKTDMIDNYNTENISMIGGMEWIPNQFGLGLRYQLGLSRVDYTANSGIRHTQGLSLSAIVRLGYKRQMQTE